MSNKNIPTVELSLSDRQPFDYVYCEGLRETRACYHSACRTGTRISGNRIAHVRVPGRSVGASGSNSRELRAY